MPGSGYRLGEAEQMRLSVIVLLLVLAAGKDLLAQ